VPWAHIDIAGVHAAEADNGCFRQGATGWGVRLLADFNFRLMTVHMTATHTTIPADLLPAKAVEVRAAAQPAPEPTPLFFGAARRSGTTWLASMLNTHPQIECRNEGWLFNDLNRSQGRERIVPGLVLMRASSAPGLRGAKAQGTWLRDTTIDAAAAAIRRPCGSRSCERAWSVKKWKKWSRSVWSATKTTTYFCTQVEQVHRIFPRRASSTCCATGATCWSPMRSCVREMDDRDIPADVRRRPRRRGTSTSFGAAAGAR